MAGAAFMPYFTLSNVFYVMVQPLRLKAFSVFFFSIVITFCFSGVVLLYASVVRVDETVKPLYFLTMPNIGTWVSKGTNII